MVGWMGWHEGAWGSSSWRALRAKREGAWGSSSWRALRAKRAPLEVCRACESRSVSALAHRRSLRARPGVLAASAGLRGLAVAPPRGGFVRGGPTARPRSPALAPLARAFLRSASAVPCIPGWRPPPPPCTNWGDGSVSLRAPPGMLAVSAGLRGLAWDHTRGTLRPWRCKNPSSAHRRLHLTSEHG